MTRQRSSAHGRNDRAGGSSSSSSNNNNNTPAVLPAYVHVCLQRLPAAAERLLSVRDRSSVRARRAAEGLTQAVNPIIHYLNAFNVEGAGSAGSRVQDDVEEAVAAAAVLADGAVREALLRLVAAGARLPPEQLAAGGPDSTDPGHAFAHACLVAGFLLSGASGQGQWDSTHLPTPMVGDFARKLLRMQTLQAISRQLAAAAAVPVHVAASVAYTCSPLLHGFTCYARSEAAPPQQARLPDVRFCTELAAALHDSCVLDHYAKLLLAPEQAAAQEQQVMLDTRSNLTGAVQNFTSAYSNLALLYSALTSAASTAAAAAQLRGVLSSRCAQHAAVVHGLLAVCMTDGGPCYGLPGELLSRVHAVFLDGDTPSNWAALLSRPTSSAVFALDPSIRAPPPGRRAALALLMRLGRLAVASGQAWVGAAGPGPPSASATAFAAHALPACLPRGHVGLVALATLRVARLNLRPLQPGAAAGLVEEVVEWWRLLGAVARHVLPLQDPSEIEELACVVAAMEERVAQPSTDGGVRVLLETPPDAAAALAGGLLPCLERLLRRAGEQPSGPEAALMSQVFTKTAYLLPLLLMYGEERQAVALVVTVGKLLRVAEARFFASGPSTGASTLCALDAARSCLAVWAGSLREAALTERGITAGAAASPPLRQLLLLSSCALCEWMPPMVRLVWGMARPQASGAPSALEVVTSWLTVLATRCMHAGGDGLATAHCEGADDTGGSSTSVVAPAAVTGVAPKRGADGDNVGGAMIDDGGWRRLLPPEVPLLGFALGWSASPITRLRWDVLAACCCAAAAAFPEQVRRAAVAAAADPGAGWRPELLRALVPKPGAAAADPGGGLGEEGSSGGEGGEVAEAVEVLAVQLASWCAAWNSAGEGRVDEGCLTRLRSAARSAAGEATEVIAAALVSPEELRQRQLLRICGNPACAKLAGDSETEMSFRACGRCGAVRYCCRECQTAHWKAGHKEACGSGRGG